jgi:hypothetical protein
MGAKLNLHNAMCEEALPPAVVKLPPAYKSPLTSKARAPTTDEFVPLPKAFQVAIRGSQRAIRLALTPPAIVKSPPTYKFPSPSKTKA